jgi:hypothetical protein
MPNAQCSLCGQKHKCLSCNGSGWFRFPITGSSYLPINNILEERKGELCATCNGTGKIRACACDEFIPKLSLKYNNL